MSFPNLMNSSLHIKFLIFSNFRSQRQNRSGARRQNYFPLSLQSEKPFEKDTAVVFILNRRQCKKNKHIRSPEIFINKLTP